MDATTYTSAVRKRRTAAPKMAKLPRLCLECGTDMAKRPRDARFCATACRTKFNNRIKNRAVPLFNLKMGERYERDKARKQRLRTLIDRLCAHYRQSDLQRQHKLRPDIPVSLLPWPSYGDWEGWLDENPWIKNDNRVFFDGTGR